MWAFLAKNLAVPVIIKLLEIFGEWVKGEAKKKENEVKIKKAIENAKAKKNTSVLESILRG